VKFREFILTSISIALILLLTGCNLFENKTTSASKMIIGEITGSDLEGKTGSYVIYSDVFVSGGGSGSSEQDGSVFDDVAEITIANVPIDPFRDQPTTSYNIISVEQIKVEYSRPDGRNIEGVDVPLTFTQQIKNMIINPSVSDQGVTAIEYTPTSFVIVTHNAKLEPPLRDLKELGEEKVLQLIAKVTVYGTDGGGRAVEPAVGYITVWCANFADATTTQ